MKNHTGITLWFTGLSASGKSTIASALHHRLGEQGSLSRILDGDHLRDGLNADLDFSAEHRHENLRRTGEVAKLFNEIGCITLVSFISPYQNFLR